MKKNVHRVYFGVLTLFIMGFVLFMGVSNPKNVKAEESNVYYDTNATTYNYFLKINVGTFKEDISSLEFREDVRLCFIVKTDIHSYYETICLSFVTDPLSYFKITGYSSAGNYVCQFQAMATSSGIYSTRNYLELKTTDYMYIATNKMPYGFSIFYNEYKTTESDVFGQIYQTGTIGGYTQAQYNAYGTSQYNAGVIQGETNVTSNPGSYSLYTRSQYNQAESTGIAIGQANVTSNPNQYGLYSSSQYNAYGTSQYNSGRTQGRSDVTTSPNTYNLYTQNQYQSNYTSGYNDGQDSILDNLSYYDLYTESEYTTYGNNMYSSGQASVTSNPNSFDLYTEQQTESIRQHGYSSGVNEVRTNPNNYELYTEQQYIDYGEYQYETGYQGGYENGFMDIDLTEAYQTGYENGTENEKLLNGSNTFFRNLFNQLGGILQLEIFPNISIGFIILLPIVLGLFVIVVKLLKG